MTRHVDSRRTTIEDVAAAAGVSVATVSRAMRDLPNVAPSTRHRVLEVAEELAYRANPLASRLATGRTMSVGMVVPVLSTWYFGQVIAGAEAVLAEAGYDLLLVSCDSEDHRRRLLFGEDAFASRLDGLILADSGPTASEERELADLDVPVIIVGGRSELLPTVSIDNFAGASLATRHLLELGHTEIGLIWADQQTAQPFVVPVERRAGFHDAMAGYGITVPAEREVAGDFTIDGGAEAMAALLDGTTPPTAVFAMSDEMAFGAMRLAAQRGVRIPEDLSVVGFDGHEFSSVAGLTTVEQQAADHGAAGARVLLDALSPSPTAGPGATGPARIRHPVELVVRTTTQALR